MKIAHRFEILVVVLLTTLLLSACSDRVEKVSADSSEPSVETPTILPSSDVEFTLQTLIDNGKLAYIGVGGEIDGVINPDLTVQPGDVIRLILLNGDGMKHDLYLPDLNAKTSFVSKIGEQTEIIVEVGDLEPGTYVYYCTVPGHRQAGQEGKLIVKENT